MAPSNSKANYRSYEAQARMIRAIVAAHPEVKWNYKDIAMYFGQSTTDGIQFQFRAIKKDAELLKRVVESGGNPATALDLTSTTPAATPSRGPGGRSTTKTPTSKRVRKTPGKVKPEPTSDAEDEDDYDYDSSSDREQSPSKRVKAKTETAPIRMTDLPRMSAPHSTLRSTQFSYTPAPAPAPAPAPPTESIFGFRNGGQDEFAGNGTSQLSFYGYPEAQDDGEI
ncbi:hypothetical protein VHEMI01370 [[Torrubiella] hemipterigena]|uniref:Uncharacterized protein n=1 Tax=[Torrubiella] hemipterigena TaxID=1531966 RepID=A0A0A1SLR7_9HYPO|nr:hypothetical protein VHEMI01370 [[Torrubiella] hemipterigena]